MFLEKRKVIHNTNKIQLISYCKDCDSQDIETIQTCKKCGSHNIGSGNILDDDPRGYKKITEEREEPFYKCDYCGKEFNGFETPTLILYESGEFYLGYEQGDADYIYRPKGDMCNDCLTKIKNKLNKDILEVTNTYRIEKVINDLKEEDDG